MANYKKMYAILCGAIDDVLEELNQIPLAQPSAQKLQQALWQAEELYLKEKKKEKRRLFAVNSRKNPAFSVDFWKTIE